MSPRLGIAILDPEEIEVAEVEGAQDEATEDERTEVEATVALRLDPKFIP